MPDREGLFARLIFGLYLWQLPAEVQCPYVFIQNSSATDFYNQRKGKLGTSDSYAFPDFDSNGNIKALIPTVKLLGLTEGYYDLKYLETLEQKLEMCTDEKKTGPAKKNLEKISAFCTEFKNLNDMLERMDTEAFSKIRKLLAKSIMTVQ